MPTRGFSGGLAHGLQTGYGLGTAHQRNEIEKQSLLQDKLNKQLTSLDKLMQAQYETAKTTLGNFNTREAPGFTDTLQAFKHKFDDVIGQVHGLGTMGQGYAGTWMAYRDSLDKIPTLNEAAAKETEAKLAGGQVAANAANATTAAPVGVGDAAGTPSAAGPAVAAPGAAQPQPSSNPSGHVVTPAEAAGVYKPSKQQLESEYFAAHPEKFWELSPMAKSADKKLSKQYESASAAREQIVSAADALQFIDSGALTGQFANFKLGFGKAIREVPGLNALAQTLHLAPTEDEIRNTETFTAAMARQVKTNVKAFGSGVSISDKDREFTEKMVGGNITLNEESIRHIIQLQNDTARQLIEKYNNTRSKFPESPVYEPIEAPAGAGGTTQVQKNKGVTSSGLSWSVH